MIRYKCVLQGLRQGLSGACRWKHGTTRISRMTGNASSVTVTQRHYTNEPVQPPETGFLPHQVTMRSVRTSETGRNKKASLVIFDKDGTLICFHSMWYPWLRDFIAKINTATGLKLDDKISKLMGYCTVTKQFDPGLLAESTKPIIQEEMTYMLEAEGFDRETASKIVIDSWFEGYSTDPNAVKLLADTKTLFKILKSHDVKIAISTSDSRDNTVTMLRDLKLEKYIDHIVCGDDPNIVPKPDPYSADKICEQLGVDPSDTVMVGDTKADVGMGKAANLGWNVGVLSGVGNSTDLLPEADHVIHSVKDLLPLILPDTEWQQYYKYKSSDRIMMEPHHLEEETHKQPVTPPKVKDGVSLVIFDLHGTLLSPHHRFINWMELLCTRMEQVTGLQLAATIHDKLGVNRADQKVEQGILSEGTHSQVKFQLAEILLDSGLTYQESMVIVNQTWKECSHLLVENTCSSDDESRKLFKTLKHSGLKIAICTGDVREVALLDLHTLGLLKYVDMMICGDDPHSKPKPSAHNALLICKEFNIDPKNTVVIGDSVEDIKMGSEAKVRWKIGVLNGVGDEEQLKKHADHVVHKVGDVAGHLFKDLKDYTGPPMKMGARLFSTQAGQRAWSQSLFHSSRRNFSTTSHRRSDASAASTYDYIVVGGGSAGCVMANRLTESGNDKVLLMEAGPKDNSWKIKMPAALMYNLCDDKYNWYYHTEPEKHMNNRVMYWPRGRTLGGSSSLNAMVYIRGNALDYDRWENEGAAGWSYASCLPYFKKAQTHELGEDDYRGGSGPLHVSRGITDNPLHKAFLEAGQQAGYPFTDDMNGYQQEGVGWMDMTIHKGWRWSAAEAYLHPIRNVRNNLDLKMKVLTTKILFDKTRAVGIEYIENGQTKKARANKEVILSGGAINSPQLLMLSGVGNADDLRQLDIPVVANLPGVGENLQDHIEVYVQYECKKPITLYSAQWKFPHNMVRIGLQWGLFRTGWGATTHLETGGFIRSRPGVEHPDLQIHFLPAAIYDHGRENGKCHAFQFHIGPMRPTSKGHLKLQSRDPKQHPKIVANYMSTEGDRQEMRDAIKLSREIFAQKAFDEFRGEEIRPGKEIQTDEEIDEFVRNHADSSYHPSCTCKMGDPNDPMAVVDPNTRVIGLEGLRVIDASIMPSVVSGNLNGPTIMLAEKAADIVRGRTPLEKSNAPVYRPESLLTQRLIQHA